MSTTRLSTKGQVVLPKSLCTAHRWKPGTEFVVQERDGGVLLKPKRAAGSRSWDGVVGCVDYRGSRKTLKQMDEAVAAEARAHK